MRNYFPRAALATILLSFLQHSLRIPSDGTTEIFVACTCIFYRFFTWRTHKLARVFPPQHAFVAFFAISPRRLNAYRIPLSPPDDNIVCFREEIARLLVVVKHLPPPFLEAFRQIGTNDVGMSLLRQLRFRVSACIHRTDLTRPHLSYTLRVICLILFQYDHRVPR